MRVKEFFRDSLGKEIVDDVFGEVAQLNGLGLWVGEKMVVFGGKEVPVALMLDSEGDEAEDELFTEEQYEAYKMLEANWDNILQSVMEAILKYYIELREERGYAQKKSKAYPEIRTISQLQEHLEFAEISIGAQDLFEGCRSVALGFACSWDQYNGVGVQLVNETVYEVGYEADIC